MPIADCRKNKCYKRHLLRDRCNCCAESKSVWKENVLKSLKNCHKRSGRPTSYTLFFECFACRTSGTVPAKLHRRSVSPPSSRCHSALLTSSSLAWWNLKRIYIDANPIRLETTVQTLWAK